MPGRSLHIYLIQNINRIFNFDTLPPSISVTSEDLQRCLLELESEAGVELLVLDQPEVLSERKFNRGEFEKLVRKHIVMEADKDPEEHIQMEADKDREDQIQTRLVKGLRKFKFQFVDDPDANEKIVTGALTSRGDDEKLDAEEFQACLV